MKNEKIRTSIAGSKRAPGMTEEEEGEEEEEEIGEFMGDHTLVNVIPRWFFLLSRRSLSLSAPFFHHDLMVPWSVGEFIVLDDLGAGGRRRGRRREKKKRREGEREGGKEGGNPVPCG